MSTELPAPAPATTGSAVGAAAHPAASATSVWHPTLRPVILSTMTAMSIVSFDGLGVSSAQNAIAGDLGHVDLLPWVFTAYAVTQTLAAVAAGNLVDALGLRRVYRLTLLVFLLASAGCTFAPSMPLLIAARAAQGIGGGLLYACANTAIGVTFPDHLRSRAFAAGSTIWGVMSFAGPSLAAALLHSPLHWRGVFGVAIPLTSFALVIGWARMPVHASSGGVRFDVTGFVIVGSLVGTLLVGVSRHDARSAPLLVVTLVLAAVYWWHAGRTTEPLLSRRLLAHNPIAGINTLVFMLFAGGVSVESFVPLFVKGGLGKSDTIGAFSVTFMALGWTSASIVASRLLDRVSETTVIVSAFALVLTPLVGGLTLYRTSTPWGLVALFSLLQGGGIGAITNSSLTLLQKVSPASEMGRANGSHYFLRNLGSTIGTAAAGGILLAVVAHRLGNVDEIRPLLKGEGAAAVSEAARGAVSAGYRWAHVLSLSLATVGFAIALRVRHAVRSANSPTAADASA